MANDSHLGAVGRQNSKPTRARNVTRSQYAKRLGWPNRMFVCGNNPPPPRPPPGLRSLRCPPGAVCMRPLSRAAAPAAVRSPSLRSVPVPPFHPRPSILSFRRWCWSSRTGAGSTPRGCGTIPRRSRSGAKESGFSGDFSAGERNTGLGLVFSSQQVTSNPLSAGSGAPAANARHVIRVRSERERSS